MRPLDISKTYLITGGAGFIGFYLSKALLEKGAKVIGIDTLRWMPMDGAWCSWY